MFLRKLEFVLLFFWKTIYEASSNIKFSPLFIKYCINFLNTDTQFCIVIYFQFVSV